MRMEIIRFRTDDNVEIVAAWQEAASAKGAALLLHMMPATKESFAPLQERLAAAGITSLAIDLRGHGGSVKADEGATLDYRDFDDTGHRASRFDVEAAVRWIAERTEEGTDRLVLVGASIGANLALQYAAEHHQVPAVVAISPGLDYRSIAAVPAVRAMAGSQRLLLLVSADDPYSANSVEELAKASAAAQETILLKAGGHGTALFEADPSLLDRVTEWLTTAWPDRGPAGIDNSRCRT